ncbi:MAG: CRISPR-associated endonuclease Cas2 [Parcubacteria group bacterium]|nr:CRISPR-associated endonuclease Cas2 [Parcubacteria group bacterium]
MKSTFKGIKTAAEYKRGELARDILRLVGAGVIVGAAVIAPNMGQVVDYFNPRGSAERKRIWDAIKYLEKRNQLAVTERNGTQFVTLTRQGRIKLDENQIWEIALSTPLRWDRKWRLVMFDFPARCGDVRHAFRKRLEEFGFVMYQRSVFIFPHECHEEVLTVAKWYGVDRHVRYIVATEINDMRRFVKEFDLLG